MAVCSTCGLPEELCICEEIAKEQQHIKIYTDKRRYGKVVTVIDGFETSGINIDELARALKTKCASGGTVKDGRIELQGEHRKTVQETMKTMGYEVEVR